MEIALNYIEIGTFKKVRVKKLIKGTWQFGLFWSNRSDRAETWLVDPLSDPKNGDILQSWKKNSGVEGATF